MATHVPKITRNIATTLKYRQCRANVAMQKHDHQSRLHYVLPAKLWEQFVQPLFHPLLKMQPCHSHSKRCRFSLYGKTMPTCPIQFKTRQAQVKPQNRDSEGLGFSMHCTLEAHKGYSGSRRSLCCKTFGSTIVVFHLPLQFILHSHKKMVSRFGSVYLSYKVGIDRGGKRDGWEIVTRGSTDDLLGMELKPSKVCLAKGCKMQSKWTMSRWNSSKLCVMHFHEDAGNIEAKQGLQTCLTSINSHAVFHRNLIGPSKALSFFVERATEENAKLKVAQIAWRKRLGSQSAPLASSVRRPCPDLYLNSFFAHCLQAWRWPPFLFMLYM